MLVKAPPRQLDHPLNITAQMTYKNPLRGKFPIGPHVARALIISGTLLSTALLSAETKPTENDKNHHLFVGPDLSVLHDSNYVAIRKLSHREALTDTPDRIRVTLGDPPQFRLKMAPKVSSNSAVIAGLNTEATYSAGTDPDIAASMNKLDLARSQNVIADQIHNAEQNLSTDGVRADFAGNLAGGGPTQNSGADAEDSLEENDAVASITLEDSISRQERLTEVFDFGNRSGEAPAYDALRVNFEISAETPMADAYAVLLVQLEVDGETNGFSAYKRIGEINENAERVKFFHEGLPAGFKIKEVQVFIYNHGEEIATNQSEKRYDITYSQAQEFVKLNHRAMHQRETVPAKPAWSLAPAELQATRTADDYDHRVTAEIDAEGNALSFTSISAPIPSHVRAILEKTTFVPALENGTPIASNLVVNVADFFKE
ncbi:MAG: hypothetical protein SynsKO_27260 [Synoicihabitans sp.]